jgi:hypothetical protein
VPVTHDEDVDLLSGERIIWTGEPSEPRLLRPEDAFLIPISLLWGGFAIFWEANSISMGAPGFFDLWGGVFVLIGLYFIAGRFVVRAIAQRHARYTVTDLRVVIAGGVTGRGEHASYLSSLQPPVIRERGDGTGDLAFGSFPTAGDLLASRRSYARRYGYGYGRGWGWAAWGEPLSPPVFRSIPMVRHVRDLVLAAQTAGPHQRGSTSIID